MTTPSDSRLTAANRLWEPFRTHPIWSGVAGVLTIAFSALIVRVAQVSPSTAASFRCLYALPLLGWLTWHEGRKISRDSARRDLFSLLAGLFFAVDLVVWHHAIAAVGAGLATVLANLQILFVTLLGWWLFRERPNRWTLFAIPIVLLGVVLVSGLGDAHAYGNDPARGALLGAFAGAAYAGFILSLRRGGADPVRPARPLLLATAAAAVATIVIGVVVGDLDIRPHWPAHGWLLLLAISSQVVGWMLISVSLPRLPVALMSVLLALQPVGGVVLARLLLNETPSLLQVSGVVLILSGVLIAGRKGMGLGEQVD